MPRASALGIDRGAIMLTHTQYALLIAIPTGTVILAHGFLTWCGHRLLKKLYSNFDRLDRSMSDAIASMSATSATTELRKRFT
jgi:hypothetical protein